MARARSLTSFSELSLLAECERKWAFRYREHVRPDQTKPMAKGSLVHAAVGAWWLGEDWEKALWKANDEMDVAPSHETVDDAMWLIERYVRYYADDRPLWKVVATELELKAKLPRVGNVVIGYIDQILEEVETGRRWLVERKTMSDWQRLSYLSVDPQLTLYAWLVRENGWDVQGILFDALRTYRWQLSKPTQKQLIMHEEGNGRQPWKDDPAYRHESGQRFTKTEWAREAVAAHPGVERDLEDSFQWLTQDRTQDHIDAALDEAVGAVRRRQAIRRGARPLRNLGRNCRGCFFQADCHSELAFPPAVFIVEDEDD